MGFEVAEAAAQETVSWFNTDVFQLTWLGNWPADLDARPIKTVGLAGPALPHQSLNAFYSSQMLEEFLSLRLDFFGVATPHRSTNSNGPEKSWKTIALSSHTLGSTKFPTRSASVTPDTSKPSTSSPDSKRSNHPYAEHKLQLRKPSPTNPTRKTHFSKPRRLTG